MDSHTPPPEHCDRSGHAPDNLASLRESTVCVSTTVGISFPLLVDSFRSRSRGWGYVQESATGALWGELGGTTQIQGHRWGRMLRNPSTGGRRRDC